MGSPLLKALQWGVALEEGVIDGWRRVALADYVTAPPHLPQRHAYSPACPSVLLHTLQPAAQLDMASPRINP